MWFNKSSFECNVNFELIGTLLGLAIYNSVLLDLNFPSVVYKKLISLPTTLGDLQEFEPDLYNTLNNISKMETGFEDLCMTMSISYDNFGAEEIFELVEGGKDIPLTRERRDEFIELYVDWYFNKSIEKQFRPFQTGFYKVISKESIRVRHHTSYPIKAVRRQRDHRPHLRQGGPRFQGARKVHQVRRIREGPPSRGLVLGDSARLGA